MLKIEDFNECVNEQTLCWKRYVKDDDMIEVELCFCFDCARDDAWYEFVTGLCLDNGYQEMQRKRFNRLKEAVSYWNDYFKEDNENDVHFEI